MPLNVLLVPLGSHGDVHPLVGIGIRLRQRGHRVRVIVNDHFKSLACGAGLEHVSLGTDEEYRRLAGDPDLWHRFTGPQKVVSALIDLIGPTYAAIAACNVPGETVIASSSLALGARIAQEKLNIPNATLHLQPLDFWSVIEPPKFPGLIRGRWVPRWFIRQQYWVVSSVILDRLVAPRINKLRAELGLPSVKGIMRDWWNSPQRVIGLFPEWFAKPQADWPPQTRLAGFPLYDERGVTALSPELERFLSAGDAPIAFTFGSAMWHAQKLLEQSARACEMLGRRGILLTRHRDQVPAQLPPGVIHVDFAPFSELLPRCAALVHHGGIGTSAQGLAAGVPQLIVPHAHDQPDNAERLVRLGVGRKLEPRQYKAARIAKAMRELLNSPVTAIECRDVAARFIDIDAKGTASDLIETLLPATGNEDQSGAHSYRNGGGGIPSERQIA